MVSALTSLFLGISIVFQQVSLAGSRSLYSGSNLQTNRYRPRQLNGYLEVTGSSAGSFDFFREDLE